MKNSKAWFLRNIYDWDCSEETNFWEIICDIDYDIQDYPSKTRNQIRRCLKDCDIRKISNDDLIDYDGYGVYIDAYSRYKNITVAPIERKVWEDEIRMDEKCEFWGVFQKETNRLIAWARNTVVDGMVNYNTLKAIPEFMNKHYPYFGLLYTMNKEYLGNQRLAYVADGFRSITEHSNIQPFLEKNFLFRKAYCKVQLFYKPWLAFCVRILYPFRTYIPIQNIKHLLKFEEIVRSQKN